MKVHWKQKHSELDVFAKYICTKPLAYLVRHLSSNIRISVGGKTSEPNVLASIQNEYFGSHRLPYRKAYNSL